MKSFILRIYQNRKILITLFLAFNNIYTLSFAQSESQFELSSDPALIGDTGISETGTLTTSAPSTSLIAIDDPIAANSEISELASGCQSQACIDTANTLSSGIDSNAAAPAIAVPAVSETSSGISASGTSASTLSGGSQDTINAATSLQATSSTAAAKANSDASTGKQKVSQELQSKYATNPQLAQQAINNDQSRIDQMNQRAQQQHSAAKNSASGMSSSASTVLKVGAGIGAGVLGYTLVDSYLSKDDNNNNNENNTNENENLNNSNTNNNNENTNDNDNDDYDDV